MPESIAGIAARACKFTCFVLLIFQGGCAEWTWYSNPTWSQVDSLENKSATYGTISAGAPRVADYDNTALKDARERLRVVINEIRKDLPKTPGPEVATLKATDKSLYFTLGLQFATKLLGKSPEDGDKSKEKSKPESKTDGVSGDISELIKDLVKDKQLEPNQIDLAILKLSVLRFLETELETLNLQELNPVDRDNYRRVQVSVGLSAWTKDPAQAALVYLDLYPFNGDWWCHNTVEKVLRVSNSKLFNDSNRKDTTIFDKELQKKMKEILDPTDPTARSSKTTILDTPEWKSLIEEAKRDLVQAFHDVSFSDEELLRWITDLADPYTGCHTFFISRRLLPRLVHVEPLANPRYVLESTTGKFGYDAGFDVSTPYGGITAGQRGSESTARSEAAIRISALSFAAGERRAGWFFMKEGEGQMRPIESRVRMVVDIPKNLKKLEVHVHKTFLDKDQDPLTAFSEQTKNLNAARWRLNDIEKEINSRLGVSDWEETKTKYWQDQNFFYPSSTYWQLVKSRVRNLLSLGWSERLVVDIPQIQNGQPALRYALRSNVVSTNDTQENYWLVVNGEKEIIQELYRDVDKKNIPDGFARFDDDYKDDYMYPGFIDTHNHPHYNFIPRWAKEATGTCKPNFCNRYEWQQDLDYLKSVKEAYERLKATGYAIDGLKYGQARALAGGVTTIQGADDPGERPTLLKNLWKDTAASTKKVSDLQLDNSLKSYKGALDTKSIKRLFLHVAEGKDNISKGELKVLEDENLLRPEVVLIHAIPFDEGDFNKIKKGGSLLVWSPRSNLTLYGKTMDIELALNKGIDVALAPDWTISGSSNMLQEIKCAHDYAVKNNIKKLTPQKLFEMVTETAAKVAGLVDEKGNLLAGRLRKGAYADFVIIKKKLDADGKPYNPYENLLHAEEEDIRLVVIGGKPALGEPKFFRSVNGDNSFDLIDVGNSVKALQITQDPDSSDLHGQTKLESVRKHLSAAGSFAPLIESSLNCSIAAP